MEQKPVLICEMCYNVFGSLEEAYKHSKETYEKRTWYSGAHDMFKIRDSKQ